MLTLLLGVVVEVFVAVSLAGLILALAIPFLHDKDLLGAGSVTARIVVVGVLAVAVVVALFRPGSTIHRHVKR